MMSGNGSRPAALTGTAGKRLDAEQCQLNAEECRALARASSDSAHRTMLEHMAETWDRLARSFHTGR